MDLEPFGLDWRIDPKNQNSVIPADFLTLISTAGCFIDENGVYSFDIKRPNGQINQYTLGNHLGSGTFGAVYECFGSNGQEYIVKTIKLEGTRLDVKSVIIETIIQIIVAEETKDSNYPELKIKGPFAPLVIDVGYDPVDNACFIVTEKMRRTIFSLIDSWKSLNRSTVGYSIAYLFIRMNKILEELYAKLQFNHRDFKRDNCMYIRDESGNIMPRLIDFGFSCINFRGLIISAGSHMHFRYCNLMGRDMAQFMYETVKYNPWLPSSFKNVIDALLTYNRGGKVVKILKEVNRWSNTYFFMNSAREVTNCEPVILDKVLTAYTNNLDWKKELAYIKPENVLVPKQCPNPNKPDYNPATKRCVKSCPPNKQRNTSFKCVEKKVCPKEKPDYNPKTKRCVKSCPPNKKRNKTFKCVKT